MEAEPAAASPREKDGDRPDGYHGEAKSHHAVAAAVMQGRADWGVTLDLLAKDQGLEFVFLRAERFDIVTLRERLEKPAVVALRELLTSAAGREALQRLGFDA